MTRILLFILCSIVVDFYIFSISFNVLPMLNTKQVLAMIGIMLYIFNKADVKRRGIIDRDLFILTIFACVFSICCFAAITINHTNDYTYVSYVGSMWTWLAGAYSVCCTIKYIHGEANLKLLTNYLTLICVVQCFLVLYIDSHPAFARSLEGISTQGMDYLNSVKRLYGIGYCLDTAGVRTSIILLLLANRITNLTNEDTKYLPLYLFAFLFIGYIGNQVARTTSVGAAMFIIYVLYEQITGRMNRANTSRMWMILITLILIAVPIATYYYNTDAGFRYNTRFAFEGFFNYFETGHWKIGSNETLKNMVVYPDNVKTWIIGDGYMVNPYGFDPYFVGEIVSGYYKGTDIGYLRFIFYCGIVGLSAFSIYIIKAAQLCANRIPENKMLFFMLAILNFVIWFKVSTDIFIGFALLLQLDYVQKQTPVITHHANQ